MATRLDPQLLKEFKEYGAVGVEKCFNCGNCTAICPLSSDGYNFPRDVVRWVQIGHKECLIQSLDPWLCYYCGDCSETCPKGAEPGETMMATRRWLTAQYDWTGLAGKFYTSKTWEFGSMILLSLLVVVIFALFSGPMVTDQVELNTFAPLHIVHLADWIMAGMLLLFVGSNVLRMYMSVMRTGNQPSIPLSTYISEAWLLIYHTLTQKRWDARSHKVYIEERSRERRARITHLLLFSGYGLMLVLIVFFLYWFQTDNTLARLLRNYRSSRRSRIFLMGTYQKRHPGASFFTCQRLDISRAVVCRSVDRYLDTYLPLFGAAIAYLLHLCDPPGIYCSNADPGSSVWQMGTCLLPSTGCLLPGGEGESQRTKRSRPGRVRPGGLN
jgi:ferredoxin